jgi:hypothetical protein
VVFPLTVVVRDVVVGEVVVNVVDPEVRVEVPVLVPLEVVVAAVE